MSGKLLKRVIDNVSFAGDLPSRRSLVELIEDSRVLIENHNGIASYNKKSIHVKASFGIVAVSGEGMELASMTKNQLVICGCISGITLYRGQVQ